MTRILRNIRTLYVCPAERRCDSGVPGPSDCSGAIDGAALVWSEGVIKWAGREAELPACYRELAPDCRLDARGSIVIPGLIDCHTHLAFGGWRADEFEQRCGGMSYLEIAQRGGGIASTVAATRRATAQELFEKSQALLSNMLRLGVTTVEAKSGYGLTVADEMKLLGVYRRLGEAGPQRIVPTLLAAHVTPPEFRQDKAGYVRLICERLIPAAAQERLAEFCDVFVEATAFSADATKQIAHAARAAGMGVKLHVDQFSDDGGARLAAELRAVSADHLEHADPQAMALLAESGVVAVVLPISAMYLRQPPADGRQLINAGVCVAVATDFNPGSAPSYHLPLAMTLACVAGGLSPGEALRGATINAARAIGRAKTLGSLEPGKQADFILLDMPSVAHWLYQFTPNACRQVYIDGESRWEESR